MVPKSASLLIRSLAYESSQERKGKDYELNNTDDMGEDMVRLAKSDVKYLQKVRADGGDFSRIFQRM